MIAWVIIGVLFVLCIAEWIRELYTFQVTHYQIKSAKLNSLKKEQKILFLSDLHSKQYGKGNMRLLEAIRKENPDLILVGGDMLIGLAGRDVSVASDFIRKLSQIGKVYYASGNHEQRLREFPEIYGDVYTDYRKALDGADICFLENNHTDILIDDCEIRLQGLEIPPTCYAKFRKTTLDVSEVNERIGQAQDDRYTVLLAHNPKFMDTYLKWGADLILSGHYHGGVVRVPGIGGVITPQGNLFPKYSGEHRLVGTQSVVVSKGLGTHSIQLRFLNPAEMIILHLDGIKE